MSRIGNSLRCEKSADAFRDVGALFGRDFGDDGEREDFAAGAFGFGEVAGSVAEVGVGGF